MSEEVFRLKLELWNISIKSDYIEALQRVELKQFFSKCCCTSEKNHLQILIY